MQNPEPTQQAPVGCGHEEQGIHGPIHIPEQLTENVIMQDPSDRQQAPVGWGHGFGKHVVPVPCQLSWQDDEDVIMQAPVDRQQAPIKAQGGQLPVSRQSTMPAMSPGPAPSSQSKSALLNGQPG